MVDLPEPDFPINVTTSPAWTSNVTPRRTQSALYRLYTLSSLIIGGPGFGAVTGTTSDSARGGVNDPSLSNRDMASCHPVFQAGLGDPGNSDDYQIPKGCDKQQLYCVVGRRCNVLSDS